MKVEIKVSINDRQWVILNLESNTLSFYTKSFAEEVSVFDIKLGDLIRLTDFLKKYQGMPF